MDLGQNPQAYIATGTQLDGAGGVVVVLQNRSPVALTDIQVTPVIVDGTGRIVQSGTALRAATVVAPNQQVTLSSGLSGLSAEQVQGLRVRVDSAKVATN